MNGLYSHLDLDLTLGFATYRVYILGQFLTLTELWFSQLQTGVNKAQQNGTESKLQVESLNKTVFFKLRISGP